MYFLGSNLSPPGAAMLTHTLITNEEQKTVSVCIINTCATNASLIHDVTNTDSQTQIGCVHGHIKKNFQTLITNKATINRVNSCCQCILYPIPIDRVCNASSLCVPFKWVPLYMQMI